MDACGARRVATERAVGAAEDALFWTKHAAKEARIEYDEYEKEQRRKGRMLRKEAEEAEKWSQIKEGIDQNNALYAPGDPEYWAPDVWEYSQLHRLWKLQ